MAVSYQHMTLTYKEGGRVDRTKMLRDLTELQYRRNDTNFVRGTIRSRGETVEIFPAHLDDRAWRVSLFGDVIEAIWEFDPLTGEKTDELSEIRVFANSHYITPKPTLDPSVASSTV